MDNRGSNMVINDVFQFLFGLVSSKNQMFRDINVLKVEMEKVSYELIPFSSEEFGLVSYNIVQTAKSRGFYKSMSGAFTTIYYEQLFAFNIKMYGDQQFACVIKTYSDVFAFVSTKDGRVVVYMNDNELGRIVNYSNLYNTRNQLIGSIDAKTGFSKMDVHIKGALVGYINKKDKDSTYLLRAMEITKPLDHDELYLSSVLVFYHLIHDYVNSK